MPGALQTVLVTPQFPNVYTTGVPVGVTLTPSSGNFTTSSNGQIIDSLNISGDVIVMHTDVVIKNCKVFHVQADVQSFPTATPTRLTVKDSEINGQSSPTNINGISVIGSNAQGIVPQPSPADFALILRCNIWNCENGVWVEANNCTIQDCYFHDHHNDSNPDPHIDGVQIASTSTSCSCLHNNFDMLRQNTSSCITSRDANNLFVDHCRLNNGTSLMNFDGTYVGCTVQHCYLLPSPNYSTSPVTYFDTIGTNGTGVVVQIDNTVFFT